MSLPDHWAELVARRAGEVRDRGRWRTVRALDGAGPSTRISATGDAVVQFAANDYLGLATHPAVVAAAHSALDRYGAGSGAARLIVGGRPVHDLLESALAAWTHRGTALLFSTGFQANLGTIGALVSTGGRDRTLVCSDELNHASIIDGIRAARAAVAVYPHRDVAALDGVLADAGDRPTVVVTDAVFSMDGDLAPLDDLAECCARRGALLVVDEAHAVLGPPSPESAVVVGTLSKTLGSLGGFVAGPEEVVDLVRNVARAFIFTTAPTPADAAAALAAVGIVQGDEGDALRRRLRANVERLRPGHRSPIIPIVLGSEERAVAVADELRARGLLVPAIRPPTVAPGTCRLRIALSAAHTPDQVDRLDHALAELGID